MHFFLIQINKIKSNISKKLNNLFLYILLIIISDSEPEVSEEKEV